MGHRKYPSERRLEMTLGASIGALHWYMLGKYLLNEGRDCIQPCWRGGSLSYCPFTGRATHIWNPFYVPSLL